MTLLILSRVDIHSVWAISRVCKRWYEVFNNPAFWQPRIERTLRQYYSKNNFPILPDVFQCYSFPLRSKVEWLFHMKDFAYTKNRICFTFGFEKNQKEIVAVSLSKRLQTCMDICVLNSTNEYESKGPFHYVSMDDELRNDCFYDIHGVKHGGGVNSTFINAAKRQKLSSSPHAQ